MTGGTGFIGRWMLEALARSKSDAEVVLLSRDPDAFAARAPHLARRFQLVAGDIADFVAPPGRYTHVIHAATDASAALNANDPRRMFDTIVAGTRRALDTGGRTSGRARPLHELGRGLRRAAVDVGHVAEDWHGGPDPRDPKSAYGEGKRAAELLCAIYGKQFGLDIVTARIFALLGPLLSLDIHFAAGNFIRDAMAGPADPHRERRHGGAILSLRRRSGGLALAHAASRAARRDVECRVRGSGVDRRSRAPRRRGSRRSRRRDPRPRRCRVEPRPLRSLDRADPGRAGRSPTVDLDEAIRRTAIFNGWKQ